MIQAPAYMELLKSCSTYNSIIGKDRKSKMPFLDPQTGIAQKPGNLWREASERRDGGSVDVIYTYPSHRWRKRKRDISVMVPDIRYLLPATINTHCEPFGMPVDAGMRMLEPPTDLPPPIKYPEVVSYTEYADEPTDDLDEFDDPSDGDDYADTSSSFKSKSRKAIPKKKTASGAPYTLGKDGKKRYFGGAAAALIPPEEKPYSCPTCGAKYKSKPGLNYHMAHVHSDFRAIAKQNTSFSSGGNTPQPPPIAPTPPHNASITITSTISTGPIKASESAPPNNYCDFCLGDGNENKKTGQPEELTSCHDCGRSGHPTCLKFTSNMMISTKKYGWQCIECKSCAICGTSENDDQLLFCDDCDRGFHLYCLNPPLAAPPEGEWSCHLCQVEFGPNASHPVPQYAAIAPAVSTA